MPRVLSGTGPAHLKLGLQSKVDVSYRFFILLHTFQEKKAGSTFGIYKAQASKLYITSSSSSSFPLSLSFLVYVGTIA